MAAKVNIFIREDGIIQFIHSDELAPLFQEGKASIRRASSVEPTEDGQWMADLKPVGGPVLGPFTLRRDALAAEVDWIERNVLGAR